MSEIENNNNNNINNNINNNNNNNNDDSTTIDENELNKRLQVDNDDISLSAISLNDEKKDEQQQVDDVSPSSSPSPSPQQPQLPQTVILQTEEVKEEEEQQQQAEQVEVEVKVEVEVEVEVKVELEVEVEETQTKSSAPQLIHDLLSVTHNLFEHFLVVGLPSDSNPKLGVSHKPELLFTYPSDKEVPPKVKEFCFPNGIIPCSIKRTPSRSNLNEMLFGQSYLHSSSHYFTFVLSSENPIYGICITKPELLHSIPNFFPDHPKSLEKAPTYLSAPRCYCFLSRVPMFNLHFDALLYILAQDRLITITRELSSNEDEIIQEQNQLQKEREHNYNLQQQKPLPPIPILSPTQQQQSPPQTVNNSTTTATTTLSTSPSLNTIDSNSSILNSDIDSTTSSTDNNIQQLLIEEEKEKEITFDQQQEEIKHLVDKQNLLDILKYYYQSVTLKSGANLEFTFPSDSQVRKYILPEGKNIQEVNAKLISEWSIGGTFANLSLECILRVLSAILLEQRVVFVCDNLSILSSCCFSMISLVHPLIWQGLFVPILPQGLLDYLEAPVPFIVGVTQLQRRNFDGLIVDIKSNKIIYNRCPIPPTIPEFSKLLNNLKTDTNILINQKNYNPIKNTAQQNESVHRIFSTIQQYTLWLFKKIEIQFITVNIHDSLEIDEFKKKFLSSVSDHNKDFIKMLLDTQHFSHFLHHNLLIKQQEREEKEKQQQAEIVQKEEKEEQK